MHVTGSQNKRETWRDVNREKDPQWVCSNGLDYSELQYCHLSLIALRVV